MLTKGFISAGVGSKELKLPGHCHVFYVMKLAYWMILIEIRPVLNDQSS